MSQVFKYIIQGLFKKLNLRLSYINDNRPRYIKAVESMGINLVLDIGANSGQFASTLLSDGFKGLSLIHI